MPVLYAGTEIRLVVAKAVRAAPNGFFLSLAVCLAPDGIRVTVMPVR